MLAVLHDLLSAAIAAKASSQFTVTATVIREASSIFRILVEEPPL